MSILVNKHTKVITQGMTGATMVAAGVCVDGKRATPYFTHSLCKCGNRT